MAIFKKKAKAAEDDLSVKDQKLAAQTAGQDDAEADMDAIMRKYDRESNTRIWEGAPKILISILLVLFSVFCIGMTLFYTGLPETRLSLFVAFAIVIGYMMYPANKKHVRVNHIPWYDIVLMLVGAGAFLYFAFNALDIIKLATRIETYHIVIAILGLLPLMELCRRCVGIPILVVVTCLMVYAFYWQMDNNPNVYLALRNMMGKLFYSTSGVIGTPINVCYTDRKSVV